MTVYRNDTRVKDSRLKPDQRRAHDIVRLTSWSTWHCSGASPPPLRMILHGEGDTGKSKLSSNYHTSIRTAWHEFHASQVSIHLSRSFVYRRKNYTHIIGMIFRNKHPLSSQTRAKLQNFRPSGRILYTLSWFIDECSRIPSETFKKNRHWENKRSIKNPEARHTNDWIGFGGINVIICRLSSIYTRCKCETRPTIFFSPDSSDLKTGHMIWTTVVLQEQVRVTDIGWWDFFQRLRKGVSAR